MIKDALQYIVDLGHAEVNEYVLPDGKTGLYSDKPLYRLETPIPMATALNFHTLQSLIDYIRADIDTMADKMIIAVESPTEVIMYSKLDENRDREYIAKVTAQVPAFPFGNFVDHEEFCIGVQSKFIDNEDKALLLKFAGTIESGTLAQYGDDGITQKATIKKGLASKGEALIPNPVLLRPYRTFTEVAQPKSSFIFRMRESGDNIYCGIFEADGGAWKIAATSLIKVYLKEQLKDLTQFTVIA